MTHESTNERASRIRKPVRALWAIAMGGILIWYFRGYLQSLENYLQPVYERWPLLRSWIGAI